MKSFHNFNIFIAAVILLFFSVLMLSGYRIFRFVSVFLLLFFLYRHYGYFGITMPKTENKKVRNNFIINHVFGICALILLFFIVFRTLF